MPVPAWLYDLWVLDLVSDWLDSGRKFYILPIYDVCIYMGFRIQARLSGRIAFKHELKRVLDLILPKAMVVDFGKSAKFLVDRLVHTGFRVFLEVQLSFCGTALSLSEVRMRSYPQGRAALVQPEDRSVQHRSERYQGSIGREQPNPHDRVDAGDGPTSVRRLHMHHRRLMSGADPQRRLGTGIVDGDAPPVCFDRHQVLDRLAGLGIEPCH